MITLYTNIMSPCAQKVRIVLAEKNLTWTARPVDLANKENLQSWYLALNPLGVVPTLVHNEQPVIESSVICEYLEDAFPQTPLRPSDPLQIAKMRVWLKHIDNKLHPSCGALQWPLVMRPGLLAKSEEEQQKLINQIPEAPRRERQRRLLAQGLKAPDVAGAVKVYHNTIVQMEATLKNQPWLNGDTFGISDCATAPYFQTVIQFDWLQMLEGFPAVQDWLERVTARESYQQAVSADFDAKLLTDLNARGRDAWPIVSKHLQAAAG